LPGAVSVAVLAVGVAGCDNARSGQVSGEVTSRPQPMPIIVDTDAGLDDAIAILYLATSPEVDLRAVTVSGTGLAHCFPGARNVVGLLELAGRPGVPVSCGPEEPAAGSPLQPFPDEWRRLADGRYGDTWRIGRGGVDDRPAPQLLNQLVRSSAEPVTLVTLGPLTNVAAALEQEPTLATGLARLVVMGGAFDVPGNTANAVPPPAHDVAEWNIYADPQSAGDVLDAGLPVRFVPLDATNDVPLDAYVLRAAARAPSTEAMAVVNNLLSGVHGMVAAGEYYLWDPLAAALAVRPELGTVEQRDVDVVTRGADAGRTVTRDGGDATVELFVAADGRAAEAALLSGLTGSPVATIEERPDVVIDPAECSVSPAQLTAEPLVIEVAADDAGGVAIGILDPGRGAADVEAFFASSATGPPDWFTLVTALGAGVGAPPADLVRMGQGDYTVVCMRSGTGGVELQGISSLAAR
jgi:pyrimidine-specific ribonucleoside hydrolase